MTSPGRSSPLCVDEARRANMVYMEDGNIIEVYSHSYELTYSVGAYA